ncbi:MAG TPA: FAD:protein FMN transferase, partial [Fibrella sp.]
MFVSFLGKVWWLVLLGSCRVGYAYAIHPGFDVAATSPATTGQRAYKFQRGLMGTTFTLTLYAPDSITAQRAYNAVSVRMDTLNQIMSDYLDGSEINRLSETGGQQRWVPVSPTLFDVLQKATTIARQSGGRYDPTIGPLSQLWRRAVRQRQFPDAHERRKARRAVSWRYIELDSVRQSVRLRKPGMRLDLGGIGQGFAIDEAQKVLH